MSLFVSSAGAAFAVFSTSLAAEASAVGWSTAGAAVEELLASVTDMIDVG